MLLIEIGADVFFVLVLCTGPNWGYPLGVATGLKGIYCSLWELLVYRYVVAPDKPKNVDHFCFTFNLTLAELKSNALKYSNLDQN